MHIKVIRHRTSKCCWILWDVEWSPSSKERYNCYRPTLNLNGFSFKLLYGQFQCLNATLRLHPDHRWKILCIIYTTYLLRDTGVWAPWAGQHSIAGLTQRQTTIYTYRQYRVAMSTYSACFLLCKNTRSTQRKPEQAWKEHANSTKQSPSYPAGSNPEPRTCCKVTVLTTAAVWCPCRRHYMYNMILNEYKKDRIENSYLLCKNCHYGCDIFVVLNVMSHHVFDVIREVKFKNEIQCNLNILKEVLSLCSQLYVDISCQFHICVESFDLIFNHFNLNIWTGNGGSTLISAC